MTRSRLALFAIGSVALVVAAASTATRATARARGQEVQPFVTAATPVAAGEYLTVVAGCHDCHTDGWVAKKGNVPNEDRMTGSTVGFHGPWGTTYSKNLRQVVQRHTEDEWVDIMRTADHGEGKPPMPWHDAQKFSDKDLRAMFQYTKSLGPKPYRLPRNLAPGVKPTSAYIDLTVRDSTAGK